MFICVYCYCEKSEVVNFKLNSTQQSPLTIVSLNMPSQQQPQLQEHQTPKIVDDDQRNKDLSQQKQHQSQQQQQLQQQRKQTEQQQNQQNSSTHNLNNNNKFSMEKSLRKQTEKCNTSLLSASTQLLKEATVAALLQRNKQCASTISTTSCSDASNASFSSASVADSVQDDMSDQCSLTQAGLEEYNIRASSYYDQPVLFHHQKQSSYAQSEGYHSYVSSSDSSSATPFLDRLRQESEMLSRQSSHHWSQNDLSSVASCASAAPSPTPNSLLLSTVNMANGERADGLLGETDVGTTSSNHNNNHHHHQHHHHHRQQQSQLHNNSGITNSSITTTTTTISNNNNNNSNNNNNNSSESTSSTETLKWLGSMSDVSEASHATGYSAVSESVSNSQLIVHSSRVLTPKRHHSESVLYLSTEQQQLSPNNVSPSEDPADQSFVMYHHQTSSQRETTSTLRTGVNHRHSPSYPPIHSTSSLQPYHQHYYHQQQQQEKSSPSSWTANEFPTETTISSLIVNKPASTAIGPTSLPSELDKQQKAQHQQQQQQDFHKSSIAVTLSNTEPVVTISPQISAPIVAKSCSTEKNECESTNAVIGDETKPNSAISLASLSPLSVTTAAHRSNHRLFPVSTYAEHSNTSQFVQHLKPQYSAGLQKPTGTSQMPSNSSSTNQLNSNSPKSLPQLPANNWHSVAELINDFERTNEQQPQKYAFMDPNKTQRISNPALKAFQKNAVQSYFERQQQQQQYSKEKSPQQHLQQLTLNQQHHHQQILRPHSFQASASAKEVNTYELLRSSLPNAYHRHQQLSPKQQQHLQEQQMFNDTRRLSSSLSGVQISPTSKQELNSSTPTLNDDDNNMRTFPQTSSSSSPEPPPPPPRSRSLMPISVLRRSSSASDYAEFREQYKRATQEKLQSQSIKNISSAEKSSFNDCGMPPAPPPRGRIPPPERRTSSASEYAAMRDKYLLQQAAARAHQQHHPHQYNRQQSTQRAGYHYMPTPTNEGWVPERPPKNPNLRVPSPDLPPPPTDMDGNLLSSDEPLPPPPPEILHRQPYYDITNPAPPATSPSTSGIEVTTQNLSPNRRNSFAGSSNRKTYYNSEAPSKVPPMVPKKPANIEHLPRPPSASIHQKKSTSINRAQPQMQSPTISQNQISNQKRKRPHNPGVILNVPPIPENVVTANIKRKELSSASPQPLLPAKPAPPLPLKPRTNASGYSAGGTQHTGGVQMRCNSKASYLPRQSLEKLNNSDPDHGSYKLTLTSNEDLVNNTNLAKPSSNSYDILVAHNGKIPTNLPDVLPLGAKLQQPHPASPTGGKMSPLRYSFGSNSSIASSQQLPSPMYPLQHRYSTPAMVGGNTNNIGTTYNALPPPPPNYLRSQSYDVHSDSVSGNKTSKFMSQSTNDLKSTRIQTLDTTHEEECSPTNVEKAAHVLSPAQSESNINNASNMGRVGQKQPSSSSPDNNKAYSSTEGRIFRAELVSTTLPTSPSLGSGNSLNKSVTRKDSLRENIEKITQLQSQLMSAHLSESGFSLSNYGTKPTTTTTQSNTASLEKLHSFESNPTVQESMSSNNNTTTIQVLGEASLSSSSRLQEESSGTRNSLTISLPITADSESIISNNSPKQNSADSPIETKSNQNLNPDSPSIQSADGCLKLIQRSEIVLRVNPTMVEASSQTDDLTEADDEILRLALPQQIAKENQQTRTTLQPRQRHPIEIDCDKMCKELVTLLPSNDKLINIILPQGAKSASDYVNDLYNPNVPLRPTKHDVGTSTLMRMKLRDRGETKNTVTVELHCTEIDVTPLSSDTTSSEGCDMLKRKVDELMKLLKRKIHVLGSEQTTIEEESAINDELGSSLINKLSDKVRPIEATKFRTYIDDIGHITSLLLSLSERLARAENSLSAIEEDSAEKKALESKRDRLLEQLEEAKHLKGDIDRRGSGLNGMLEKNLNANDFADFDYFINMKAKLIADSRDISDKIKYGEEQLNALSETLLQSDC